MTDEEILRSLKSGTEKECNKALDHIQKTFKKQARRVMNRGFLADKFDQLYAESLADLWENIRLRGSFQSNAKVSTYFIGIVRNKYRTYERRYYQEMSKNKMELKDDIPIEDSERELEEEISKKVMDILKIIPADCQRLLKMRYLDGMKIVVIAELVNKNYDAVAARISWCRDRAKKHYELLISDK